MNIQRRKTAQEIGHLLDRGECLSDESRELTIILADKRDNSEIGRALIRIDYVPCEMQTFIELPAEWKPLYGREWIDNERS